MLSTHALRTLVPGGPAFRVGLTLLVVGSLLVTGVSPAAAQESVERPALLVDLQEDGSADTTLVLTYDLTSETERQAFQELGDNASTVADLTDRFEARMTAVAAAAAATTDREMAVSDPEASLSTVADGDLGIVRLSVTIENLAAVDGDRLVLAEPFANGFVTDRPVVVRYPSTYTVASVTPEPDARSDGQLTWDSGTDFEGFEVVLADESGVTGVTNPGFGIGASVVALAGLAALGYRRRD